MGCLGLWYNGRGPRSQPEPGILPCIQLLLALQPWANSDFLKPCVPALSASWVLMKVKLESTGPSKGKLDAQMPCKCWGSLLRKRLPDLIPPQASTQQA